MKILSYSLVLVLLQVFGCSRGGGGDGSGATPTPTEEEDLERYLTIDVYVNDTDTPAQNFQAFLLNHTYSKLSRFQIDSSGKLKIHLVNFRRFENYSIHIVDDTGRYVGAVTLDGSDLFNYLGGVGENLGEVVVSRNSFGTVDLSSSQLDLASTTGFQSAATGAGTLDDFVASVTLFSQMGIGANLYVYDVNELLNGFYLSASNTLFYQQALSRWSGVSLRTVLANEETHTLVGGTLIDASRLVKGSRTLTDPEQGPRSQPTWQAESFTLTKVGTEIDTTLYPQIILDSNEFIQIQTSYYAGSDDENIQTYDYVDRVGMTLTMPPLIEELSQGVASTSPVDYSNSSAENGLTNPICRDSGDLYLQLSPPTSSGTLQPTYDDFTEVHVEFEYYYTSGGKLVLADLETNPENDNLITSDFPSGFTTEFTNSSLPYAVRTWNPHLSKLVFNFQDTGVIATHNLQIYSSLFLESITSLNDTAVTRIRLKIKYKGPKHQAGIVLWLENC